MQQTWIETSDTVIEPYFITTGETIVKMFRQFSVAIRTDPQSF